MLKIGEFGKREYESLGFYSFNFSASLKLFHNKNFFKSVGVMCLSILPLDGWIGEEMEQI